MIVVHKQFLADQWRERIQQFCPGATIGVVQQNKKEVNCDFVIAMLQSLSLKEYNFSEKIRNRLKFSRLHLNPQIIETPHHLCEMVRFLCLI